MSKTKVLHIINSTKVGGIEKFVYYLVDEQKNDPSLDVSVLFCGPDGPLKNMFDELGVKNKTIIIGAFDFNISKYIKLIKLINTFDVVHVHSFKPIRDWVILFYSKKIIYTMHSVYGWGRETKKTDLLRRKLFISFLNRKENVITYNSNYTKEFWTKNGVNNTNSCVLYNGVVFKSVSHSFNLFDIGLSESDFVIGTTCRLIEWKRVDFLIRAFSKFQINKSDVKLLIVGDGKEKSKLELLAKKLNIDNKILFVGEVLDVQNYQNSMNVCVFPSTTEAFGLVAIECMNLGKPVLVMKDGGGITEIVKKIEPMNICNDVEGLEHRMNYFYNVRCNQDIQNKRIEFSRQFDMRIISKDFKKVYLSNI